jgi:hypothetical protein
VADHARKELAKREVWIDTQLEAAVSAGIPEEVRALRMEKTIVVATAAIVEAIWKARF